jgi:hypothetical protein
VMRPIGSHNENEARALDLTGKLRLRSEESIASSARSFTSAGRREDRPVRPERWLSNKEIDA